MIVSQEKVTPSFVPDVNMDFVVDVPLSLQKKEQFDGLKHNYKCSCCGKGFLSQNGHFPKTSSPLFKNNGGYAPWCLDCADKYLQALTKFYNGDEKQAVEHYCIQIDWMYSDDVYEQAKTKFNNSISKSLLGAYSAKKNLATEKSYIDTIKYFHEHRNMIESNVVIEDEVQEEAQDTFVVTKEIIKRWGNGFSSDDLQLLEEHYQMLKEQNPNCDSNQEIFIKDLCFINMMKINSIRNGDVDKATKSTTEYRNTFKQAGLKTVQDDNKNADDCWGLWCQQVAQFTPEEYYKDKKLYQDFDKIGEYFERFVLRPLRNLQHGTKDRDPEFCVKEESDE